MAVERFDVVFSAHGAPVVLRNLEAIAGRGRLAERSMTLMQASASRLDGTLRNLRGTLGLITVGFGVREIINAANTYQTLQNRIRIVSGTVREAEQTFRDLFEVADRSRTPISGVATTYERVARATQRLGKSNQQLLNITETIAQAVSLSGSTAEGARGALVQFGQALDADFKSVGQEMQSIREQTPRVFQAIVDGLTEAGVVVDRGDFRKKLSEGLISSVQVAKALESQAGVVAEEFAVMELTISQAFTRLENAWIQFIGQTGSATGVATVFANAVALIAANLDKVIAGLLGFAGFLAVLKGARGLRSVGLLGGTAAATTALGEARGAVSRGGRSTSIGALGAAGVGAITYRLDAILTVLMQIRANTLVAAGARPAIVLGGPSTAARAAGAATAATAAPAAAASVGFLAQQRERALAALSSANSAATSAIGRFASVLTGGQSAASVRGILNIAGALLLIRPALAVVIGAFRTLWGLLARHPVGAVAIAVGLLIDRLVKWGSATETIAGVTISGFDKVRFIFFAIGELISRWTARIKEFALTLPGIGAAIKGIGSVVDSVGGFISEKLGFTLLGGEGSKTGAIIGKSDIFGEDLATKFLEQELAQQNLVLRNQEKIAQAQGGESLSSKQQKALDRVREGIADQEMANRLLQETIALERARTDLSIRATAQFEAELEGRKAAAEVNKELGVTTSELGNRAAAAAAQQHLLNFELEQLREIRGDIEDLKTAGDTARLVLEGTRAGLPQADIDRRVRLAEIERQFSQHVGTTNEQLAAQRKELQLANMELEERTELITSLRSLEQELLQGGFLGGGGFALANEQLQRQANASRQLIQRGIETRDISPERGSLLLEGINRQLEEGQRNAYRQALIAHNDWASGVKAGLLDVADATGNFAEDFASLTQDAFKKAEDAIVEFVQTGKLDIKSLVDDIEAQLLRLAVRQGIINPLSKALFGVTSSGGGGGGGDFLGGLVGKLFGGGPSFSASPLAGLTGPEFFGSTSSGGGFSFGSLFSGIGSFFSSLFPFAHGGTVFGPTPALIGERGPEAIVPLAGGRAIPVQLAGGEMGITINNTFTIHTPSGAVPRETQTQIAARIGEQTARALRRNT